MTLVPIPPVAVAGALPQVRRWIAGVAEESDGLLTIEGLISDLKNGEKQLWVVFDGAGPEGAVLTYQRDDPLRTVVIMSASGDGITKHASDISVIEDAAKTAGSRNIVLWARRGWIPIMKKLGYRPTHTILEKRV